MNSNTKTIFGVVVVVLIIAVAYLVWNKPDDRNGFQKAGDAISALPNGPDKAARELKDNTPGDRVKDAVHDATH